jgi:hypothetical protein
MRSSARSVVSGEVRTSRTSEFVPGDQGPLWASGRCPQDEALATLVPASDSCHLLVRAGFVKAVFACTFTRQLEGCGCPAVTTALTGSARSRTILQREQGLPTRVDETCCTLSGPRISSFGASRPALGPSGMGAVA